MQSWVSGPVLNIIIPWNPPLEQITFLVKQMKKLQLREFKRPGQYLRVKNWDALRLIPQLCGSKASCHPGTCHHWFKTQCKVYKLEGNTAVPCECTVCRKSPSCGGLVLSVRSQEPKGSSFIHPGRESWLHHHSGAGGHWVSAKPLAHGGWVFTFLAVHPRSSWLISLNIPGYEACAYGWWLSELFLFLI